MKFFAGIVFLTLTFNFAAASDGMVCKQEQLIEKYIGVSGDQACEVEALVNLRTCTFVNLYKAYDEIRQVVSGRYRGPYAIVTKRKRSLEDIWIGIEMMVETDDGFDPRRRYKMEVVVGELILNGPSYASEIGTGYLSFPAVESKQLPTEKIGAHTVQASFTVDKNTKYETACGKLKLVE